MLQLTTIRCQRKASISLTCISLFYSELSGCQYYQENSYLHK